MSIPGQPDPGDPTPVLPTPPTPPTPPSPPSVPPVTIPPETPGVCEGVEGGLCGLAEPDPCGFYVWHDQPGSFVRMDGWDRDGDGRVSVCELPLVGPPSIPVPDPGDPGQDPLLDPAITPPGDGPSPQNTAALPEGAGGLTPLPGAGAYEVARLSEVDPALRDAFLGALRHDLLEQFEQETALWPTGEQEGLRLLKEEMRQELERSLEEMDGDVRVYRSG